MNDPNEFAIQTRALSRRFGSRWAVRDLELNVPRGCVYGFLGLNGAGKSTTIRMLMGLLEPTSGSSRVAGLNPVRQDTELKRRVGYVADTPNFYEWMTVREICAFAAHYRAGQWDESRADHLTGVFGLPRDQQLKTLSKGQRAKVNLLLALAFNPEVLILDEPTLGLDPLARRQFVEGVLAEYMEGGRTILISSHLVNEIAGLVDHIGVLRAGTLVRSQPTEELLAGLKRVRLYYDDGAPGAFACTGLIRSASDGREAVVVLDGYEAARAQAELSRLGATSWKVEDLSLEDAFLELAGPGGELHE